MRCGIIGVVVILMKIVTKECVSISSVGEKTIIGETDKNVDLKWNVSDVPQFSNFFLYYNNNIISSLALNKVTAIETLKLSYESKYFKGRFKGKLSITNGNGICEITLSTLKYNDSGVIILINKFGHDEIQGNVTLIVQGGPDQCEKLTFPTNYTCEAENQISGNVTLCGKPRPHVTWFIGDKAFKGSVDETIKSQHQYTYSFNKKVTSDMCGQNMSYEVFGYTGTQKVIVSKVLLNKFNVRNPEFKHTKRGCPILTWEAEHDGLCEIDMFVSFLQNYNSTINVTIPVKNQSYQNCSITMNSTAVYYKTIVYMINENGNRVQISKDDNSINKTIVHNVELQTTTTTTTTTITTTTTTVTPTITTTITTTPPTTNIANTTGKQNCSEFGLKMIGVLIGGIFIGLMLACFGFVVYTKRINRKMDEKRKERKTETVIQPIEENYSSLMTSFSNGKSIYADLQHTQKNESNYEIMDTQSKNPVNYEVV